jgi:hypothetical protein
VVVGIIAGPLVSNGINPYSWQDTDEITKQLTRCVIAIQVSKTSLDSLHFGANTKVIELFLYAVLKVMASGIELPK